MFRNLEKNIVLFFVIFIPSIHLGAPVYADSIQELQKQKNEITDKIGNLNQIIEDKKAETVNLENQVAIFDAKIEQLELQIQETDLEIEVIKTQIDDLTKEIGQKQRMLDYQKEILDESLQLLYEKREQNLVLMLLSAKDFSDFVDQVTYIETVKERVRITITEINKIKSSLEAKRGELNNSRSDLEDLKQKKVEEQSALENQKYSKQMLLEQTKGEEAEFQKQLNDALVEENSIEAEIDKLIEEAKKKLYEKYPGLESDGQGLGYPLAGVNRVGVIGGDFMDPYYGFGFPHYGIDLYAEQGTPIYSVADGVVIISYDSGGSGLSYIAIQHTNGLVTKYLHVSDIFVATGDYVSRGEVVGLTGGTPGTRGAGYFTTGPHLHFEINDTNGNALNPHDFLDILPAY